MQLEKVLKFLQALFACGGGWETTGHQLGIEPMSVYSPQGHRVSSSVLMELYGELADADMQLAAQFSGPKTAGCPIHSRRSEIVRLSARRNIDCPIASRPMRATSP